MVSRPGSPPDPGLQCSRVSIAVYLDLVECVGDLAQVVCGELDGGPEQRTAASGRRAPVDRARPEPVSRAPSRSWAQPELYGS
jgi:hypothetical protein